jgi:hypothetical protein
VGTLILIFDAQIPYQFVNHHFMNLAVSVMFRHLHIFSVSGSKPRLSDMVYELNSRQQQQQSSQQQQLQQNAVQEEKARHREVGDVARLGMNLASCGEILWGNLQ